MLGSHCVERSCRLVEEDDGRVLEEHTCDGDTLLLSARKVGGLRLESIGQLRHLVIEEGLLGGIDNLFIGGSRLAVTDILFDGATEDVILLQDEADVVAQILRVVLLQVVSVEQDAARLRLVELVKQVDDGRFASAREAHESRNLVGLDVHIDVPKCLGAIGIGEIDVLDIETSLHLLRPVVAARLHFLFGFNHAEITLGIDECVVERVEDALQLRDGRGDVGKKHHVVHDLTDGHARIVDEDKISGEDDDQHGAYLLHELLPTVVVEHHLACAYLIVGKCRLDVELLLRFDAFAIERLDDVDRLDDRHDAVRLGLAIAAHLLAPTAQLMGLVSGDPDIDRHDEEGGQAHIHIGHKHQDQCQEGRGEEGQEVDERILHRGRKRTDTLVDTRLQATGLVAVAIEVRHAIGEDAIDGSLCQVTRNTHAHPFAEVVLRIGDDHRQQLLAKQDGRDNHQDMGSRRPVERGACQEAVHILAGIDEVVHLVHRPVEHDGVDLRDERPDERQDKRDNHVPLIRLDKRPDFLEEKNEIHYK